MISTMNFFTVQSRLKIANNPNFDSTSNRRAAPTARMKTNFLEDNISIQFEGEPKRRTPRVHQIVVENFAFFVMLDGLTYFLVRYFQHVLCIVDNKRASLHENQVVVSSDLVLRHRPLSSGVASWEWSSRASASFCLISFSVQPSSDNDFW